MWKLVVIMCALGNPCVVFEEDPMRYYRDRNECMANASVKHSMMTHSFENYGYVIESSNFTCEQAKDVI